MRREEIGAGRDAAEVESDGHRRGAWWREREREVMTGKTGGVRFI